jgi:hypothetical protein
VGGPALPCPGSRPACGRPRVRGGHGCPPQQAGAAQPLVWVGCVVTPRNAHLPACLLACMRLQRPPRPPSTISSTARIHWK